MLPSVPGTPDLDCRADRRETSGLTVAGSLPTSPASEARSVPCPFPVALRLPNSWTWSSGRECELRPRAVGDLWLEVISDAHRTYRVRTRWAGSNLVKLLHGRQDRPRALLHDIQVGSERRRRWRRRLRLRRRRRHRCDGHRCSLFGREIAPPSSPRRRRRQRSVSGNCGDPRRVESPVRSIGLYPPADLPEGLHRVSPSELVLPSSGVFSVWDMVELLPSILAWTYYAANRPE